MVDVSRRYFSPSGILVISVSNTCTHSTGEIRAINHTQEKLEIHDHVAKWLHLQTRWPIIISSPGHRKYEVSQLKDQSYVIITCFQAPFDDLIQKLEQQLHALKARVSWNPRGLFLVLISERHGEGRELVRQVLELLWSFKAFNVLVTLPDSAPALVLYTWFPYRSSDLCTQVKEVALDTWLFENGGHFASNSPLFPPKIPYDMKGCNITVSTLEVHPFVFLSKEANSKVTCVDGVECRLFLLIMKKLNMTFHLKLPGEEMWGDKLANNSWSGMKGHLYNNISDVAFGGLFLDTELCSVFECTDTFFQSDLVWHLPRAEQIAKWKSLIRVFKPITWIAFLAACVTVTLLLWRMARSKNADRSETPAYANFSKCFSNVWAVVLGVSVSEMPHTSRPRVLFLIWLFYCLHMNIVYLSFLTTFMIHPGFEHQIQNVEELVDSDMEYGYHMGYDKYFKDPTDAVLMKILNHRKHCDSGGKVCLERMVKKGDFAFLVMRHAMEYITTCNYIQQPGKPLFYSFQDAFHSNNFVVYLTKGNPLLDRINTIIRHAVEAGLLDQWWREMKTSWILSSAMEIVEESSTLTLSHLQSAYVIMFLGLGICLAVFVVEVIYVYGPRKHLKKAT
jgi:hypothetical protein